MKSQMESINESFDRLKVFAEIPIENKSDVYMILNDLYNEGYNRLSEVKEMKYILIAVIMVVAGCSSSHDRAIVRGAVAGSIGGAIGSAIGNQAKRNFERCVQTCEGDRQCIKDCRKPNRPGGTP